MGFIEFSRSEILILSNIIRLVRQETGLPLKMQSDNFLTRLNTAITACKNQKTHQLYQEFLDTFSQPDILAQFSITKKPLDQTPHHEQTINNEDALQPNLKESKPSSDTQIPAGKRKIVYRGQVKYVDK